MLSKWRKDVRDGICFGHATGLHTPAHVLRRCSSIPAATVEVSLNGSMLTWEFYREGKAAEWMRADLDAVLAPYLAKGRRAK